MSPSTTVVELHAQCERGVPLVLLDVRRRPVFEVADSTIPGAVWRDPEEVGVWSNELFKGTTTVVYCVHGHGVSQKVAAQLQELGSMRFTSREVSRDGRKWAERRNPPDRRENVQGSVFGTMA
jgi:thiosulfate sulfurtransferase